MSYEGSWLVDDEHKQRQKGYVPVRYSGNMVEIYQLMSRSCRIDISIKWAWTKSQI